MSTTDILEQALKLKPEERFIIVDQLIKSIDKPDKQLDAIWLEEAESRLKAYRKGDLKGISMEEIF